MEAALTFPIPQARVEVRGDTVTIDGVDGEDTVRNALEIGARVLDREATGAEVDFVRREFEKLSSEVERSFADKARAVAEHMQSQFERFLGEDSGAMAKALDSHSEELGELIARHFGGDRSTAVQHQLRELMSRALQESRADLLRQFSAEDGHNPLASFTSTVRGELRAAREKDDAFLNRLAELRAEIQRLRDAEESRAELEAERERGTAKGRSFEEA